MSEKGYLMWLRRNIRDWVGDIPTGDFVSCDDLGRAYREADALLQHLIELPPRRRRAALKRG